TLPRACRQPSQEQSWGLEETHRASVRIWRDAKRGNTRGGWSLNPTMRVPVLRGDQTRRRGVADGSRWLYEHVRSRCLALLLVASTALAACSSGGGTSKAKKASSGASSELAAETASYDLAVGPPARYMVGVLTQDKRGVSYGTVQLRFC